MMPSIEQRDNKKFKLDYSINGTSNWLGRDVTVADPETFPFLDLFPEMQALVGQHCDDSTRMSLYLTCKKLYYTPERSIQPSRPRMSGADFAKAAILNNNPSLVKYALEELEIEKEIFIRHLKKAAKRNNHEIFKMDQFKDEIPNIRFKTLEYAAKTGRLDDFKWVRTSPDTFTEEEEEALFRGYIHSSNLPAIKDIFLRERYILNELFEYGNSQVLQWFIKETNFTRFNVSDSHSLGRNRDLEVFKLLVSEKCDFIEREFILGAIESDNVEVLKYIKPIVSTQDLLIALSCRAYNVFISRVKHVPWWLPDLLKESWLGRYLPVYHGHILNQKSGYLGEVLSLCAKNQLSLPSPAIIRDWIIKRKYIDIDLWENYLDESDLKSIKYAKVLYNISNKNRYKIVDFILKKAPYVSTKDAVSCILLNSSSSYSQKCSFLKSATIEGLAELNIELERLQDFFNKNPQIKDQFEIKDEKIKKAQDLISEELKSRNEVEEPAK